MSEKNINLLELVENKETSEFYPTPKELVEKMLSKVNWDCVETILEPSAGKGNILREIARKEHQLYNKFDVDCIEIDSNLRQILKFQFSDERERTIDDEMGNLEAKKRCWNSETREYENTLSQEEETKYEILYDESRTFFDKDIHIVNDDFLTYEAFKRYDLIIMNPPFSCGAEHLLKALKMQERGGQVVCLLNAETIRNPYTHTRQALLELLNQYNAEIEYIDNAFANAERKANVDVALIKVDIPKMQEESDIFNHFQKAEHIDEMRYEEITDLEVTDYIKAITTRCKVEIKAGIELIRQYKALSPYIMNNFTGDYKKPLLVLKNVNDKSYSGSVSENDYVRDVRLKYWKVLLSNPKFVCKLTSSLQDEYRQQVYKLADYDFNEFNICTLVAEMNSRIKRGIEDEILVMFDRLTEAHSYYPEFSKNIHYYNGWKTNQAHKIGKKVILPCSGVFSEWSNEPRTYEARKVLEDIERILNFLDGHMTEEINSWSMLNSHFSCGNTKNIPLKYFKATFYKKGTVHITFNCPELIDRFNIYAGQKKGWLPPSYGKKTYSNMSPEEKAVVDSFQGEEAYNEVMKKQGYYLAPVTEDNPLLLEA